MIAAPTIRLAAVTDARRIAELSRSYIETGLGWSWTPERVLRAIRDEQTNVAVADVADAADAADAADRAIGFGIMHYGDWRAHLALLAVARDWQRRGLGTRLLLWLERCADLAGLESIRLEARSDSPVALAFYRSLGYQVVGTAAGYYSGRLDAIRLEKRLWVTTPD